MKKVLINPNEVAGMGLDFQDGEYVLHVIFKNQSHWMRIDDFLDKEEAEFFFNRIKEAVPNSVYIQD